MNNLNSSGEIKTLKIINLKDTGDSLMDAIREALDMRELRIIVLMEKVKEQHLTDFLKRMRVNVLNEVTLDGLKVNDVLLLNVQGDNIKTIDNIIANRSATEPLLFIHDELYPTSEATAEKMLEKIAPHIVIQVG